MNTGNTTTATKANEKSYRAATDELERIVASLEQGDLNIDELSEKIKTATELLQYCKNALHAIEEDVNALTE